MSFGPRFFITKYPDTIHFQAIDDTNHRLERLYDAIETGKLDLGDLALRIKELRHRLYYQ
ncbi:hypothetical protein ACFLV8_01350 [Chloroflexota bacterium]